MAIELRQLRYFLAVAERLHFGHAAEDLGLAQPSLSQQIRRLEDEIGTTLFLRSSRGVEPTAAGEALLGGARRTVLDAERAVQAARDAGAGRSGTIVVGAVSSALNGIVPVAVRTLREGAPDARVFLHELDNPAQFAALGDGRIDVGFVRSTRSSPGLGLEPLLEDPLLAVLPEAHPLAGEEAIDPRRLRDDAFVLFPRVTAPDYYDELIGFCRRHGFSPRVVLEATGNDAQLGLVAAGVGVTLQVAPFANLRRVGVVYRPLLGRGLRSPLLLATRLGERSPLVLALAESARAAAAAAAEPTEPVRSPTVTHPPPSRP